MCVWRNVPLNTSTYIFIIVSVIFIGVSIFCCSPPAQKNQRTPHIWMDAISQSAVNSNTQQHTRKYIYSIVCCCISTTLNTAVPSMLLTIPFPVNERANVFCCSPIFFSHPGGSKPPSSYRNIINFCLFLLNVAAPFL